VSDDDRGTNPYGSLVPAAPQSGEIVQASRAMQEVQAAIIMAKKDPRNTILATDNALAECKRPTLARTAIYTYPRGGTNVEGPSIRLAEAIARSWGNLQYGIVEVGRDGDESAMLAYAWDLQSNNMARQEFKVKHVRDTRNGSKALTDERDIYETNTNAAARRLRACILKLIPGDVVDACMDRCKLTLEQAMGRIEEAIPKMLGAFSEIGVTQQMVEKRLKKSINAISYQDLVNLGNILNAVKDGMGGPEDYFEMENPSAPGKPAEGATVNAARAAAAKASAKPQGTTQTKKPEPTPAEKASDASKPQERPFREDSPRGDQAIKGDSAPRELFQGVVEDPAKDEINGLRGECYQFISTRVPTADRHWFTVQADQAKTAAELVDLKTDMLSRYEVF
jgi:hypothetical protein